MQKSTYDGAGKAVIFCERVPALASSCQRVRANPTQEQVSVAEASNV